MNRTCLLVVMLALVALIVAQPSSTETRSEVWQPTAASKGESATPSTPASPARENVLTPHAASPLQLAQINNSGPLERMTLAHAPRSSEASGTTIAPDALMSGEAVSAAEPSAVEPVQAAISVCNGLNCSVNFDEVGDGVNIGNRYDQIKFQPSSPAFAVLTFRDNCSFGGACTQARSLPNSISTSASGDREGIAINFIRPVNNLKFFITSVDNGGTIAQIQYLQENGGTAVIPVEGSGKKVIIPIDLGSRNITRVKSVTVHVNDAAGLSYDDFTFNMIAPSTPTGLSASVVNQTATLSWNHSADTHQYQVKRATTSGGPYTVIQTTPNNTYKDDFLSPGTTYFYVVTAISDLGQSGNSNQVTVVPILQAPSNLTAKAGFEKIDLRWDPSPGASSYVVKRSFTRGGPYTTIATTPGTLSFEDIGLAADTEYFYVVTARGGTIETAPSTEASARTPLPCGGNTIPRPAARDFSVGGWTGRVSFTDHDGLVATDIRLNGRYMAKMISAPYFNIKTNLMTQPKRGEFKLDSNAGEVRVRLVKFEILPFESKGAGEPDLLELKATYAIDRLTPGAQSCMQVEQSYQFRERQVGERCEPTAAVPCARFWPIIRYKFEPGSENEFLQTFNTAQRLHLQINGFPGNGVGLFHDCNRWFNPSPVPLACGIEGLGFDRKWNPLDKELWAQVISRGRETGLIDNLHQSYNYRITEPFGDPGDLTYLSSAGCPECFHMHWRWSGLIPNWEMFQKFGAGRPIIGTKERFDRGDTPDQDLEIAVVRYKPGEEHPNNYRDLLSSGPPSTRESIITMGSIPMPVAMPGGQVVMVQRKVPFPGEVVFWYSATSHEPREDQFFSHGGWFNPNEPNKPSVIQPRTVPPLATEPASLFTSESSDKPTDLIFGHQYLAGTTTFAFFDTARIGQLPPGYTLYNNNVFDIDTDAIVSGPHTINFNVPSVGNDRALFDSLRILRVEPDPFDPHSHIWVDVTVLAPDSPAPNFDARTITSKSDQLGKFLIARKGTANIQPPGSADLSVAMQASANHVVSGSDLTYTITVTNNGPQAATNVRLFDGIPPDVQFVSAFASSGECEYEDENGAIYCQLGSINAGTAAIVTLVVRPDEGDNRFPPEGKLIDNYAQAVAFEEDSNLANNTAGETTTALPSGNAAPTIEIVSPVANSYHKGPLNLTVRALASDRDGTVAQVNFYDGDTLIGAGSQAGGNQYRVAWNNVSFGPHTLTAVVTDNGGRKSLSASIAIHVNGPANISLTNPAEGSVIAPGSNVVLTTDATHPSGSISKVEFFANSIPLGTATSSPYSITWANVMRENYVLIAKATDNNGFVSESSPVAVSVTNPRSITITSPQSGASFASQTNITINASVQDSANMVQGVDFYADGELIGSGLSNGAGQYSFTWRTAADGVHSLVAAARDSFNVSTTSNTVDIAVNIPNFNPGEVVWFDDDMPRGARPFGVRDSWFWVDSNPAPFSGNKAHQSLTADFFHQHGFDGATFRMPINTGDKLYAYIFLHPGYRPQEIMLEWRDDSNWEHRAYWSDSNLSRINFGDEGTVSRRRIGSIPVEGQWVRLEVPAEMVGLNNRTVNGMSFILYGGRATFDRAGKTTIPTPPQPQPEDTVWFDDSPPPGASLGTRDDHWFFVSNPVFSGVKAHQTFFGGSNDSVKFRSHFFTNASTKLEIKRGDVLFAYVFLDPTFKPDQIILEWHDGNSFAHRAYWGTSFAVPTNPLGTEGMRFMGALPPGGQWFRLEVPASYVGLEGKTVSGMSFGMHRNSARGLATWDLAGKSTKPVTTPIEPLYATTPIYRFFRGDDAGYFYFTNKKWGDGLQSELPSWYVHANQAAGTVPLYRYRSTAKRFFYTMVAPNAQGFLPGGTVWQIDTAGGGGGIAFYIYPNGSTAGTVPLHIFRGPLDYFYSVDRFDSAAQGMEHQGVMGYVNPTRSSISPTLNPIDEPEFFVHQHYLDFLDREPDEAGLAFWVNDYNNCPTSDLGCIDNKRNNISAAFFLSIEFQQTGYFAYRYHKASYGQMPRMENLFADKRTIGQGVVVGAPNWEQTLNQNKDAFASAWVDRPEFKAIYDSLNNEQYVDKLYLNAGVIPSQATRDSLVGGLNGGTENRVGALRRIVGDQEFIDKEFNRAFVLMQYFGYMRRNPDDSPDNDLRGFNFWLEKLVDHNGNFLNAEMVKSFLVSIEYRQRFGQPAQPASAASINSGGNVSVKAGVITSNFLSVSSAGTLKVSSTYPWSYGPPPEGYQFYKGLAWQTISTATTTFPATLTINIPWEVKDAAEFATLRVLSREGNAWVDRTILPPDTPSHDFTNRTISARINSLSTVAIARQGSAITPTLSITSPANGATFNTQTVINIAAGSFDPDTLVNKVQFYDGNTLLGEDSTVPYSLAWADAEPGNHTISVRALDSLGTTLTIASVAIKVDGLPAAIILAPSSGAVFDAPASIAINASASDADGISKVEFFQGATRLSEDTTAPYSFIWGNVPSGNYSLTVKATDTRGSSMTSSAVNVRVVTPNQPPVANAGGPYSGTVNTAIQFNGNASSDADGTIAIYQWGFGDGASGTGVNPTHIYTSTGSYTARLTVKDNAGASHSATTSVNVAAPVNGATFISQSVPNTMIAGRPYQASVTVKNTGTTTWTAATNYNLGSQNPQDNLTWAMARVALPSSVTPGNQVTFNFTVTAPATAGSYNFQWRMVQDTVAWFGDFSTTVNVSVSAPSSAGLIAHWKFDEGSGLTAADATGNGQTATLQGPTWNAGKVGPSALSFDGIDDRLTVAGTANLNEISNNFTLSFWAYPRSTHGIDAEGYQWGGTSGQKYAFEPRFRNDPDAGAGVSVGTNGVSVYEHASNYMPARLVYQAALTGWTHITIVYENKQPKLYVNGTLARTGLTSPRSNVFIHPQDIGGMPYGSYDGLMDEVRVYNKALSAVDVQNIATEFPVPVGYWRFDEGSGTIAADSYNNGNDGTLQNGAAWANGKMNKALSFDGVNDDVKVGAQKSLAMSNQMTISAWVYSTGSGGMIANREGEYEFAVFADGSAQWAFANSSPGWNWVNTGYLVPPNQWTHLTFVYDNGVVKTYANGSLVHTYNGAGLIGDVIPAQNEFRVGGRQCCAQFFKGRLDEVLVYNTALRPEQISALAAVGRIVFTSARDGNQEIYVMNADGSNHARLTNNAASDAFPAWSPDGTKILFESTRDGNNEIYLMNADGSDQVNLTNNAALDLCPAWSPDGTKIAFHTTRDGQREIYSMNADGTNPIRLTNIASNEFHASWSPDGTRILFASNRDGNNEIYVMNADGSNQINLSLNAAHDIYPAWSPDGTKIAFSSARDGNDEIYLMNPNGSNQVNITNHPASEQRRPTWSADGSKIAFASNRDGNDELYLMNANGSLQVRLTSNTTSELDPAWQRNTGTNRVPAANAGGPYAGQLNTAIQFNGSGSSDADGTIIRYSWDFGDGTSGTGASPTHAYAAAGNYTARLTVTDEVGAMTSAAASVSVTTPTNGAMFIGQSVPTSMTAGQTYNVSVTLRNTGTTTWASAGNYMLGTHNPQDNTTWGNSALGLGRIGLPSSIAPNTDATFNFSITAPSTSGSYNFQRRMLQNGVEWFGDLTPNVVVTVNAPPSATAKATYVKTDTTTQGNWKGVYGSDGYAVASEIYFPQYAQVGATGTPYTWAASTADVRALQKPSSSSDRIAACQYNGSSFNIDVNLTDGLTHQVALYSLDWDSAGPRQQRIDILDGATGIVLDTRTISGFTTGHYLVWNLSGYVKIKITNVGGSPTVTNAVASGIFFDSAPVAHWTFDEGVGTTAADVTGRGNTGTLVGSTWSAGRVGAGALNFDGLDDRVAVASSASLSGVVNNFTVAFWANPRSTHQIDPQGVTGVAGVGGQRWTIEPINKPDPDAGAGISVGTNGVSVYEHAPGYMPATLVYPATLNGWTHVAVVYDNKLPRLYINGVPVKVGQRSPRANVFIQPPDIGGMVYGYFDGQMDDVRIYNQALGAAEVRQISQGMPLKHLALNRPATQSSTLVEAANPIAERATDGNTNGNYYAGFVTHTNNENQAWWQVDLGDKVTIQNINIWNRTDCCGTRLSNFYVFVSDVPFIGSDTATIQNQAGVSTYPISGMAETPTTIPINRTGRYVRVQMSGLGSLSLAEVQVFGVPPQWPIFGDDFNDNALDTSKWSLTEPLSSVVVREQNQRLEVVLQPSTAGYNGVYSNALHDFSGRALQVEVAQATSMGGWTETFFQAKLNDSNYYHMSCGAGSFVMDAWNAGVRDRTVWSYDPTTQRFWRFRHDAIANTMNFEVSADGQTWTTGKTVPVVFPINAMRVYVLAGAWGTGNSTPGMAIFDNLRLDKK